LTKPPEIPPAEPASEVRLAPIEEIPMVIGFPPFLKLASWLYKPASRLVVNASITTTGICPNTLKNKGKASTKKPEPAETAEPSVSISYLLSYIIMITIYYHT
jgi:hypothetical protein